MKINIRSLGYDPESDNLDLLINSDRPVPAYAVHVGAGVYIRREFDSHRVVGAIIDGYGDFAARVRRGEPIPTDLAAQEGLVEELEAIVAWQREVDALSRELATHLGDLARQQELLEPLIKVPA